MFLQLITEVINIDAHSPKALIIILLIDSEPGFDDTNLKMGCFSYTAYAFHRLDCRFPVIS